MANESCVGSVRGLRLRVARLSSTGTTPAGASNGYVTDAFVRLSADPVYDEAQELSQANAQGDLCVYKRGKRRLKSLTVELSICTPDAELTEILAGGTLLTDGGDSVGWAAPEVGTDPVPNGVSLEVWSDAVEDGGAPADDPYWWQIFPKVFLTRGPDVYENGVKLTTFTGHAEPNANWGNGPFNDWTSDSSRITAYKRTDTLPTAACGYTTVPVQA